MAVRVNSVSDLPEMVNTAANAAASGCSGPSTTMSAVLVALSHGVFTGDVRLSFLKKIYSLLQRKR